MPRRCIAAGCDTKGGMGYTAYTDFPKMRSCKRNGSKRLSDKEATGMAHCLVHSCDQNTLKNTASLQRVFVITSQMGIPALKQLKPHTIPTLFPRSIDYLQRVSRTPSSRPLSERRQERSVSILIRMFITTSSRKLTNQQV